MQRQALFFTGRCEDLVDAVQRFRKTVFVERCGWRLSVEDDREVDAFDTPLTVHLVLLREGTIEAAFRAIRTDRPYLAAAVFPKLAVMHAYPQRSDVWEISRFGVLGTGDTQATARINYALMFAFARRVGATSLVAIADLAYERFLRTLGIRTRRYGPPRVIGTDGAGRPLKAVAGEIPLDLQEPARLAELQALLHSVEVTDAAEIFGPARVSA